MSKSEFMKTQPSLHTRETVVIYLIAAALLTAVMVIAFVGWQGQ
jgi:hypothetical protein